MFLLNHACFISYFIYIAVPISNLSINHVTPLHRTNDPVQEVDELNPNKSALQNQSVLGQLSEYSEQRKPVMWRCVGNACLM